MFLHKLYQCFKMIDFYKSVVNNGFEQQNTVNWQHDNWKKHITFAPRKTNKIFGERGIDRHPRRSTAEVVFVEKNMPMQSKRNYKPNERR